MESSADASPKKRRPWRAISLRSMLLLVLVVGAPMGWWARRAQLQRAAVARIEAAGGAVFYAFEILDVDGGASTEATERVTRAAMREGHSNYYVAPSPIPPPAQPWKNRLRRAFGVDFVDAVAQVIVLDTDKLRDDDLSMLDDLPMIECINLGQSPINDRAMVHVGKLRGLKRLYLNAEGLSDAGIAQLARLDRLKHLGLYRVGRSVTDAGLGTLEVLTNLDFLIIEGPGVTDRALDRLGMPLPKTKIPAKPGYPSIEGQEIGPARSAASSGDASRPAVDEGIPPEADDPF